MKWIVFCLALLALVPAALLLRSRPALQRHAVTLLGFLPFIGLDSFDINFVSNEQYRGDSRGFEVTIVDLVAWALLLALPRARRPAPYRFVRLLYLGTAVWSAFAAPVPLFAWFSVWKLARMYVVLAVVARACEDEKMPSLLLRGMGLGVVWEACIVFVQHFRHIYRPPGNFSHPNTLAMACNLVALVALAVLLARKSGLLPWLVVVGASMCVVFSLSRGALVMLAVGIVLVFLGSVRRLPSGRKLRIALGGMAVGTLALLWASRTLIDRFLHAPKESAEARIYFEQAAWLMLKEHPFGVGINQFSHVLESGYAERVGIGGYDASGIVHNIYRLTSAELGWLGLFAYLCVLGAPFLLAVRHARRAPHDVRADVLLGCAVALLVSYAQGMLEWLSRQTAFSYLFWMVAALVAALAHQLAAQPARQRSPVRLQLVPSAPPAPPAPQPQP